jgi:hypothetical protein
VLALSLHVVGCGEISVLEDILSDFLEFSLFYYPPLILVFFAFLWGVFVSSSFCTIVRSDLSSLILQQAYPLSFVYNLSINIAIYILPGGIYTCFCGCFELLTHSEHIVLIKLIICSH